MSVSRWFVVLSSFLLVAAVGSAEEPAGALQPTPEHRALEAFVGEWTGDAEMRPGPFGPGGPVTWTEECSWFGDAGFHVVCESEGRGPTGPMKGLGILGYDAVKEAYTHYGVDTTGWSGLSEGTRSGDTWTFESREVVEGATHHSRFSITMETPARMSFTWALSEDGESWTEMMSGTSERR